MTDTRCEGWRRYGGVFTFGPVKWEQCKNTAIYVLTVEQDEIEVLPACLECYNEAKERGIKIINCETIND